MVKIYGHGSYIGNTGYNQHTRDFFRHLSKHAQIKFRNFTVGNTWDGMSSEPHNNEPYLNDVDKKLLFQQVLWNTDKTRSDYKMYEDDSKEFFPDLNIVLCETNHHLFYDNYYGPKIAYNVWESTLQPEGYFNKLKEFDELWVPSKWQRQMTINQGYDANKIKVVPEGVDVNTFYPEITSHELTSDGRFKFFLAGRWDYRKSIKEIIETFLKTFDKGESVDLIISVDNPFSNDGLNTTEERLKHYGMEDDRIKILHFPPREDYIKLLKSTDCFVSCARSEGWNLPLIESMACGTPSIYSNCSGQLEFAEGKGIPVNIIGEKPVSASEYNHFNDSVGNYYEPDFNDLSRQMRNVVSNYQYYKQKALEESEIIRKEFNWERIAEIGINTINEFLDNRIELVDENKVIVSYLDGPRVEIKGDQGRTYFVEFIDGDGKVRYSDTITNNMWTACGIKYYVPWTIKVNGKIVDQLNLENKRVLISFESKAIGDTIAWVPYVVDFSKKHNCKVILSTFHNDWFKGLKEYSDIEFISPGQSTMCDTVYRIGWFRSERNKWDRTDSYPNPLNSQPLQKTSTDILGLDFVEKTYGINFKPKKKPYSSKYVVIAPESTAGCKEWTYDGWRILIKMLEEKGYQVVCVTHKPYSIEGAICVHGKNLIDSMNIIYHAEFLIGLSSGLSWINWSLGKHTVMICGFTEKNHEFQTNVTRLHNEHACNSCWANINFTFDGGDWDWCPIWKGTDKQHICQKSISPKMVMERIKDLIS